MGSILCLFGLGDKQLGLARVGWLAPLALFLVTLVLTKSRGGMIGFVAACGVLSYLRFGKWKTLALACVAIPALVALGGRQTDMAGGLSKGTGEQRVELWYDGLNALKQCPVFGIGAGQYPEYVHGRVAHNAFVHAYVELGLLGGTLFVGAFWFVGLSLWKLRDQLGRQFKFVAAATVRRLDPYSLAILCGSSAALMSLSRTYVIPTYLVVGIGSACCLQSQREGIPAAVALSPPRLGQLLVVSAGVLVAIYAIIRITLR
jgi:O-antigen ligase